MQKPRHEVTINLSVTVAGDDVDWKENLAGAIMNLSFHVADLETVVSNGAIFPIGEKGDVDTGTFKFLLHGCVSKEVQDEMQNRKEIKCQ
jgi:hypothetical protein